MAPKITVRVKFFAYARELAGTKEITIDVDKGTSIEELMDGIIERYAALDDIKEHLIIAVNKSTVGQGTKIRDGDEVALLPPVSGG